MDEIKYTKFDKLSLVYLTMLISGASSFANNDIIKILVMGLYIIYAITHKRKLYNNTLNYLIFGWCFINILASLYFDKAIGFYQFIGKLVLFYTSFLILSCSNNFWKKFEQFLYKITIISLVLYIISLIVPNLFVSLSPIFRPFTDEFYLLKENQRNYFYAFVFVFRDVNDIIRNNGFMWEPGAFAMVLNILIAYNFITNDFKFNRHIKIYIIALFTTFSTAGYLSFFLIILLVLLKGRSLFLKVTIITVGFLSLGWLMTADFLLPKIQAFIDSAEQGQVSHQGYRALYEANRILSFKFLFDKFLIFPIGWGTVSDSVSYMALNKIVTVNGLGNILVTWGAIGFAWMMSSIIKFFYNLSNSKLTAFILFISVAVSFFSNPIENNAILFILVLSPYITTLNNKNL